MTIQFTQQRETWTQNNTSPLQTAQVTYVATDDAGADITTSEAEQALGAPDIGDGLTGKSVYAKTITWSQTTPKLVQCDVTYDSVLFNPGTYDEDTPQSVDPTVQGYVNTDITATTYNVDWWRYRDPGSWVYSGTYPWTTATPTQDHQQVLEAATSSAVDAAGTPLGRPILGQQLVVSLTFESKPTALREYWRSLRGTRNAATFLGDDTGEWLFTGANQHATTSSEMYTVELSFYRDPFGWCRQRPKTDAGGGFPLDFLTEVDSPSGQTCADSDKTLHASCVAWVQLHPVLGDFTNLMTSAQMDQVEDLIE